MVPQLEGWWGGAPVAQMPSFLPRGWARFCHLPVRSGCFSQWVLFFSAQLESTQLDYLHHSDEPCEDERLLMVTMVSMDRTPTVRQVP